MRYAVLIILMAMVFVQAAPAQEKYPVKGDTIPAFSLRDQDGKIFNSRDYIGKNILVIYFYPKDESSICTKEACSFRDRYADFIQAGAIVVGINHAAPEIHRQFQVHHHLPFTLLSDPGNKVLKMFGVKNKFLFTGRETFVIDKSGKIVFRFDSFSKGEEHQEEALKFIKNMNGAK
ncbi:MAG: peroxiredoxin [Chitinophagaceae bacterium]|nr:peroxiredoxin [Chitinophagaceae bacterium]